MEPLSRKRLSMRYNLVNALSPPGQPNLSTVHPITAGLPHQLPQVSTRVTVSSRQSRKDTRHDRFTIIDLN
jgi:hypothetical protein